MTRSTGSPRSGRALLTRYPPDTREAVEELLHLEAVHPAHEDHRPLVRAVVQLAEHELTRLLLEPLRPSGDALAAVLEERKSGRKAGETLRFWSLGEEVRNVTALASRVLQALRTGFRSGDSRVTALVKMFFSPDLGGHIAKPRLGLTLERFRSRFRDPVVHERGGAFSETDHGDLLQIVLGANRARDWHASGPDPDSAGFLDLLLRGARLPTDPTPTPQLAETALEVGPASSAALVAPPMPKRLGQYALLDELGRGGMGIVFKGWDSTLDRPVAIKVLRCAGEPGPEALRRFGREARAAARLRHENIVVVHEVVEQVDPPYLVMQFVEGQTLDDWLERTQTPGEVSRVTRQVALALHYAHERGVIHRDVKPANIMISEKGRPVLMDFGVALDLTAHTRLTSTGQIMGTPKYMAPEQIEGDPAAIGVAADVYALGAVLYRALCGRAPFEAGSPTVLFKQVLLDAPTPPRAINPEIPQDLEAVVLRCLAKVPAERYPTAAALAQALERCC